MQRTRDISAFRQRRRLGLTAMLGATAMVAPFATPALAQVSEGAVVDSNTIIVTAQRRAEALEDVPMTVTVLSQETLANAGVTSVRDLADVTSGFQVNNSGTYTQPAIRGVTTTNSGSYENNVALYVDGLYQITPSVLNMDLPNVQNIQILKGPQGTLYGRNATGGAILIDTIDPSDFWQGLAELTYARFDDKRARSYVAGPISDGVGISLAGTFRKTDGYYKKASLTNPLTRTDGRGLGLEQESVRAKVKFDLTDSFRAIVGYNFLRASDPRGAFFTPNENTATPYPLGVFAGNFHELDLTQHEGLLRLELDTGLGLLRSISGYQDSKLDTVFNSAGVDTVLRLSDSRLLDETWQTSLDYNIDAIDRVNLLVGASYFHNKQRFADGRASASYSPIPGVAGPGTPISTYLINQDTPATRTKEAWAIFGDFSFDVTDQLTITVGGRYSEERQRTVASKFNYCADVNGCTVGGVNYMTGDMTSVVYQNQVLAKTYSKFTPSASIRYEITPRTSVYVSYTQGFKAGETNSNIPFDNPATWDQLGEIGQETIDSFEIGFKHAGNRLRFDMAGFYYDYKNLQVSSVQFDAFGRAAVLLQNLPKARIYGVEANIDYEVVENFNLRAGATWLNARYGDRAVYVGTGVSTTALTNAFSDPLKNNQNRALPFFNPPGPMAQDISGMQMARSPDFAGYVGFDYTVPNGDGGLTFSANLKYTDSYVVTDPSIWGGELLRSPQPNPALPGYLPNYEDRLAADPNALPNNSAGLAGTPFADRSEEQRARQNGYVLINASVTWTDPTDSFYVRIWGKNLTNEVIRAHYRPSSTSTYAPILEPLTYGATAGFKF